MTDWISGTVVENTHWTHNLFSLRIKADIDPFVAGQYTSLALDLEGKRIGQPYSILSAPGSSPLEFFFYTQLEGDLSRHLSRTVAGDTVWVGRQPEGTLTLANVPDTQTLCLMATGTGVAPFVSMLQTEEIWQRFATVVLVYAARLMVDLRYRELFDRLTRQYPGRFVMIPFISREQVPGTLHGHIPAALAAGDLETHLGMILSPENAHIMLCGNPGMVKDTIDVLQARGFRQNTATQTGQLSFESYW